MNNEYQIVKMHICSFLRTGGIDTACLGKYPVRLCVLDKNNRRAIDVVTMHEYPYVKMVNMKYLAPENNDFKIEIGKRYACVEYKTILSLDLSSKELDRCKNIISLLNNGYKFKDGNKELTNEQYLQKVYNVEKTDKLVKKLKKRK